MKPVFQLFLFLCFLFISGESHSHAYMQRKGAGDVQEETAEPSGRKLLLRDRLFLSAPSHSEKEMPVLGILDDSEDREEDDETSGESKAVTGISHAAICARPRAPGADFLLRGASHTSFCKHYAWSLEERFIVLRVFRV